MSNKKAMQSNFKVAFAAIAVLWLKVQCWSDEVRYYICHDGTNAVHYLNGKRNSLEEMGAAFKTYTKVSKSIRIPIYVWPKVEMKEVWSTLQMMCRVGLTNVVIQSDAQAFPPEVPSIHLRMEPPPRYRVQYEGGQLVAEPEEEEEK